MFDVSSAQDPLVTEKGETVSAVWTHSDFKESDEEQRQILCRSFSSVAFAPHGNTTSLFHHWNANHTMISDRAMKEQNKEREKVSVNMLTNGDLGIDPSNINHEFSIITY